MSHHGRKKKVILWVICSGIVLGGIGSARVLAVPIGNGPPDLTYTIQHTSGCTLNAPSVGCFLYQQIRDGGRIVRVRVWEYRCTQADDGHVTCNWDRVFAPGSGLDGPVDPPTVRQQLESCLADCVDGGCRAGCLQVVEGISRGSVLRYDLIGLPSSDRRVEFSLLDSESQSEIWASKLDQVLSLQGWSREQVGVLEVARTFATPSFFDPAFSEDIKSILIKPWEESARKVFDRRTLRAIVASLDNYVGSSEASGREVVVGACHCSETSDYCDDTAFCQDAGCRGSFAGCGFLWSFSCGGRCLPPRLEDDDQGDQPTRSGENEGNEEEEEPHEEP